MATSSDTTRVWFVNVGAKTASYLDVHSGIVLGGRFGPEDKYFVTWCSAYSTNSIDEEPDTRSVIKLFHFEWKKPLSEYVAANEYVKVISDKNTEPIAGITTCKFMPFHSTPVAATTSGHILIFKIPNMALKHVVKAKNHLLSKLSVVLHKQKPYCHVFYLGFCSPIWYRYCINKLKSKSIQSFN